MDGAVRQTAATTFAEASSLWGQLKQLQLHQLAVPDDQTSEHRRQHAPRPAQGSAAAKPLLLHYHGMDKFGSQIACQHGYCNCITSRDTL